MRKILLLCGISVVLISCNFKDEKGQSPLIMNEQGYLVDNHNYEVSAEREAAREDYRATLDDGSSFVSSVSGKPTVADREKFAETFKPKTGKTEIILEGKDKTTIILKGYMVPYTVEQYENLNYFDLLKKMGFKKVIFLFGKETVAIKNL